MFEKDEKYGGLMQNSFLDARVTAVYAQQ